MTKFVVLRPIERKTAEEVVNQLFDIFVFLVPHTYYRATMAGLSIMFGENDKRTLARV